MRFPVQRHQRLLNIVQSRRCVSATELAGLLGASLPTVRRDLAVLGGAGLLVRTHGGAATSDGFGRDQTEPLFLEKMRLRHAEKKRIAAAAADMIDDRRVAILDSGTTALALAQRLADRDITVITMDLKVAEAASTGRAEVLLLGGRVRNRLYSLVGGWTKAALNEIRADVFFLTADALDETGVTNATVDEAEIKAVAASRADRTILIADHTKIGRRSFVPVCSLDAIHTLVTDRAAEARLPLLKNLVPDIRLV